MSQLIAPKLTFLSNIPLGRKITEVMKEKGSAFSIQAVANRLGISRETLRLMLVGERDIYEFELKRLSEILKMPVDRLTEKDTLQLKKEYDECIISDPKHALFLANRQISVSNGITERCNMMILKGQAHFELREYEEAHDNWLKAYNDAIEINQKYGESNLLFRCVNNLIITSTVLKEFRGLNEILSNVEPKFTSEPELSGALLYSHAMSSYQINDMKEAQRLLYQSLDHYMRTNNQKLIGKAEHNVAYIEYKLGNYSTSEEYFERSIESLATYKESHLIAIKDYVKVLLKVGSNEKACELIEKALHELEIDQNARLNAKIHILYARATNNPKFAQMVLEEFGDVGLKERRLSCKFLLHYYSSIDDAIALLKYFKIYSELGGETPRGRYDILDEEDL